MDIDVERLEEGPWLSGIPSSPRMGSKVARPPRSPSTLPSPYSKKRDLNFADVSTAPTRKPGHRRSASDSVTYLENLAHSSVEDQLRALQEAQAFNARVLNSFGEAELDGWPEVQLAGRIPDKRATKHRRGASEGGVSHWMSEGDFSEASLREPLASVIENSPQRGGHQCTISEPPACWSEEASFASEEDIKPCISGQFSDSFRTTEFSDTFRTTEDNRLVGLAALKQELGISGPLKESELELLQMDPRKAKRVLANRQSAQKSRIRKLHYISDLERRVHSLEADLKTLQPRVTFLDQERAKLNSANSELKKKIAALQQETGFKDALNDALQKEVDRLRGALGSHAHLNGQSVFPPGGSLPGQMVSLPSEPNGQATPLDFSMPMAAEGSGFDNGSLDFGQSRDSFQHFLDSFNGPSGPFMLDSL